MRPPALAIYPALVVPLAAACGYFVVCTRSDLASIAYGATKLAMLLWPLAVRWRWGAPAPLAAPARWRAALIGLACGALMAAVVIAAAHGPLASLMARAQAPITAKCREFGIAAPGGFFVAALVLSLAHSALEEYYWRWFVWRRLRDRLPIGIAHVVAGIGFAAHHAVIAVVYVGMLPGLALAATVALAGIAWSVLYQRTGTLVAPWLAHVLTDLALMLLGAEALGLI